MLDKCGLFDAKELQGVAGSGDGEEKETPDDELRFYDNDFLPPAEPLTDIGSSSAAIDALGQGQVQMQLQAGMGGEEMQSIRLEFDEVKHTPTTLQEDIELTSTGLSTFSPSPQSQGQSQGGLVGRSGQRQQRQTQVSSPSAIRPYARAVIVGSPASRSLQSMQQLGQMGHMGQMGASSSFSADAIQTDLLGAEEQGLYLI